MSHKLQRITLYSHQRLESVSRVLRQKIYDTTENERDRAREDDRETGRAEGGGWDGGGGRLKESKREDEEEKGRPEERGRVREKKGKR